MNFFASNERGRMARKEAPPRSGPAALFRGYAHELTDVEMVAHAIALLKLDHLSQPTTIVGIGGAIGRQVHEGQRLKFADGDYFEKHVLPVASRMETFEQIGLALMHDVPEELLSIITHAREYQGKPALAPTEELEIIDRILFATAAEFRRHGIEMGRNSPFILNLDALTKRSWEEGETGYPLNTGRIIARGATGDIDAPRVKLADIDHNADPNRNPLPEDQSPKRQGTLRSYLVARPAIAEACPEAEPLPPMSVLGPPHRHLHVAQPRRRAGGSAARAKLIT